jgi:hypothetical protein
LLLPPLPSPVVTTKDAPFEIVPDKETPVTGAETKLKGRLLQCCEKRKTYLDAEIALSDLAKKWVQTGRCFLNSSTPEKIVLPDYQLCP